PARVHWEKLFVKRRQPALDPSMAERTFAGYRPVRHSEGKVSQCLGLKLSQQRPLKRVFERRVDHIRAVLEHSGDKAYETVLGIIFMNKSVRRLRLYRAHRLADLVDIYLVRELCPKDDARFW